MEKKGFKIRVPSFKGEPSNDYMSEMISKKTEAHSAPMDTEFDRYRFEQTNPLHVSEQESASGDSGQIQGTSLGSRIFEWVSLVSLGILFFMLPLYFTGSSMQGLVFEKQILFSFFVLMALVGWVTKGIVNGTLAIKRTPLDLALAGFIAAYVLSTIVSIDKWHSFWGFFGDPSRGMLAVVIAGIAYYMVINTFSYDRLKLYVGLFIASGSLFSLWTLFGVLDVSWIQPILSKGIPRNILGETSQSPGLFLALSIPVLLASVLLLFKWRTKRRMLKMFGILFLTLSVILNLGLTCIIFDAVPTIALISGLVVFMAFILGGIVKIPKGTAWFPTLIFALVLTFSFTNGFNLSMGGSMGTDIPYSAYWNVLQSNGTSNFFVGTGPATYGYVFAQHYPQILNESIFSGVIPYQSRGVLFEMVASLGAIGTVFFCLLLLTFVGACIYMLSKKGEGKIFSLGLFSASIVFIVTALITRVEGSLVLVGTLLLSLTMASIMLESSGSHKEKLLSLKASPKYALSLAFLFIVASAVVVYAFVFIGKMYAADLYAGSAAREETITEGGSINKLSKAILLSERREGRYMTRLGQEYAYLANQEVLKNEQEVNVDALKLNLNNAIQWAELGHRTMDKDILALEALAQIYESSARYVSNAAEMSVQYYQRAHDLYPNSPVYFVKLGEAKLAAAATEKDENQKKAYVGQAREYFQQAIEKKKSYPLAYYRLGISYEALGDLDLAVENIQNAFFMENRTNVVYAYDLARIMAQRGNGNDYKNAETLLKDIIATNDREVNAHFNLGLLYEKTNRRTEASGEYEKIIGLLGDNYEDVRTRLRKMIDNIKKGIENNPQTLNVASPATTESASGAPIGGEGDAQTSPVQVGQ